MARIIDLNETVYDLVNEYPEIKDIMIELGFKDITNPAALNLMGRVMTIPKGAAIKNVPMEHILEVFKAHGFEFETADKNIDSVEMNGEPKTKDELLKTYIQRLNNGEDLESVRKDFVENFESVTVHEIIGVEQDLIDSGMEVEEVQKLCDLHSALFHGKTEAEIYMEEEKEMNAIDEGHPVDILTRENRGLEKILNQLDGSVDRNDSAQVSELLMKLKTIKTLYGKKEELIMPILYRYGVTGPSDVMWGVDDEIKSEYSFLAKNVKEDNLSAMKERIENVITRTREMIYKEENILFPMALERFTDEEWVDVYNDIDEMGTCFIDEYPKWKHGDEAISLRRSETGADNGMISLSGGKLSIKELEAIFKLLPVDITFIDADENNQFFANEGKVFSRPMSALGRKVYDCHPPRIVPMVKQMISEFKAGTRDSMEVWTPNPDNPIRVLYCAVRDDDGNYLGTVELVQQFKGITDKVQQG